MVRTNTALTYVRRTAAVLALSSCMAAIGLAQTSGDVASDTYADLLQRIADTKTNIAHQQVYIGTQEAEIASLQNQIESVPAVMESIGPMLVKMGAAIGNEIESDLPFNAVERYDRLASFTEILEDKEARTADKWRRALGIYNAEVSYGQTIQAYAGNHPIKEKAGSRIAACEADDATLICGLSKDQREKVEDGATISDLAAELKDGHYLRYGRLSLAYMQADESDVYRFDAATKAWVEVTGSKALDVRRAMKMARGEAAPTVVQAPILRAN